MITIAPHDPGWAPAFRPEAADLHRLAPSFLVIEHIGSAAIPGLAAIRSSTTWLPSMLWTTSPLTFPP